MKKLIALILICALACLAAVSYAEPTASPSATPAQSASASASGLISYGVTGEIVVRIQLRLRELGYFNYKPTGNFQNMTVEATKRFQQRQTDAAGLPIMADGTVGEQSLGILFSHGAQRADITANIPIGPQLSGVASVTGELVPWSEVSSLLSPGTTYQITDYNTGSSFSMKYTGGSGHAEVECASPSDTALFLEAFGGTFNYSKRPVVIQLSGRMIAASLQGYPHGDDQVSANEMAGHACLFFDGSLSHVANLQDVEHQAQVYKAAGRS